VLGESVVRRSIAVYVVSSALLAAGRASAQDAAPRERAEWCGFPGGGLFFTQADDASRFSNVALGSSFALRVDARIAVEAEAAVGFGRRQTIDFGGRTITAQPMPDTVTYSAGVIVDAVRRPHPLVPYVAAGAGALVLIPREGTSAIGFTERRSLPTAHLGGGLKWYAREGWGLRADYRATIAGHDDRPSSFFGNGTRIGHRFYGGGFTVF
jgi:hypothetical protein